MQQCNIYVNKTYVIEGLLPFGLCKEGSDHFYFQTLSLVFLGTTLVQQLHELLVPVLVHLHAGGGSLSLQYCFCFWLQLELGLPFFVRGFSLL